MAGVGNLHNFRYPVDKWVAAQRQAKAEGTNLSALLCEALDDYLATGLMQVRRR